MKIVMVEPKKPAYVTEIGNDYKSIHDAVGGLIEPIYYLNKRGVVMVGNEESKLLGMDGNRRFGGRIVAGPFFICGDNGEAEAAPRDFCSLPDDLCEKYVRKFAVPESISQDEVQADMGFTFISF